MLKAMRRNLKALAPTLWLVIIAFIITIFAVWGGAGRIAGRRAVDYIAIVGKDKISTELYRKVLLQRLQNIKNQIEKELDRQLIEQLNLPQQILNQMIQEIVILHLAKELGVSATDDELRNKIMSFKVFQRNGKFVGFEEYKRILNWNRISISEFEDSLRREITINKVIKLIIGGLPVTDQEVLENYKRENEYVELEYIIFNVNKIKLEKEPEQEQLKDYFFKNKKKYKIPEKRKGALVFIKFNDLKPEFQITEEEIKKYYQENTDRFKIPEKIRVSRIYISYKEKDKEKIREKMEEILNRIKKGEDFAELAKKYSEDEKQEEGGDWGEYEWQRLNEEEQKKIGELAEGEISNLIELDEGFSIIKVTRKVPSRIKSLEEVRDIIKDNLLFEKTGRLAEQRILKLEKEARKKKSLKKVAEKMNYKIETTSLLKKGDSFKEIDPSGLISQALFKLKKGEISSPIYTFQGVGLVQLEEIQPSRQAKFNEVKDKVMKDLKMELKKKKALELAKRIREELLKNKENMEKISQKFDVDYKKVEKFKRGNSLAGVGFISDIEEKIFTLELDSISLPFEFSNGYILAKVLKRKEIDMEEFEKNKEKEREKLRNIKTNMFFNSYLSKQIEKIGVKVNYSLYEEINNEILSRFER
jgi:peptidyl-prolyl cis-trans isomerase D